MAKQWVQHISGQGEKWEVASDSDPQRLDWIVYPSTGPTDDYADWFYLPKSEYRLCDPPEVWRDVTGECMVTVDNWPPGGVYGTAIAKHSCVLYEPTHWVKTEGYRLRKVQLWEAAGEIHNGDLSDSDFKPQWAFIVEQKVTE